MPWVSPRVMYIDWCCIILHIDNICSWLFVCFVCYCFYVWLHAVISYNGMNKVFCVLCVQVKGVVPWDWHSQQQGDVWRLHWQDATHLWSQQQKGRHLSVGEKEKKGWGVGGGGGGAEKYLYAIVCCFKGMNECVLCITIVLYFKRCTHSLSLSLCVWLSVCLSLSHYFSEASQRKKIWCMCSL